MADEKKRDGRRGSGGRPTGSGGARSRGGRGKGRKPARGTEDETVARLSGPLERVLKRLPDTQRQVLEWRMGLKDGHPRNLADTAREMGLSMGEARDIEKRAFEHIREAVPVEHLQKFLQG